MVNAMGGIALSSRPRRLKSSHGDTLLKKGVNMLKGEPALDVRARAQDPAQRRLRPVRQPGPADPGRHGDGRLGGPAGLPRYLTARSSAARPHGPVRRADPQPLGRRVSSPAPARSPNKVAQGGVGTRSGQSVVLLGGSAQSLFRDMRDGRLG